MAPPKDIARSYPKRGLTADVGFRSEPAFVGDGSAEFATGESAAGTYTNTLNSTLSMCCWVKVYNVSQTYFMDIGANSPKGQISISYHNGTGAGINKRPYIWNGSAVIYATQEMEINEWHHLAVTSAPGAGNIKIYLDGVDVTPSHSTDVNITTNDIYLGKWIAGSGNFDGKMANAALFRTTLTQEQVRECMRASSFSQFDAISTLEAFYPLDANFNDSTSGGHDLTATGSPSFTVDRPQLPRGLDLARGAAQARVYTGRALDQDGSVDRLQGTNFTDATATACTVSFWMYQRDGGPGRIIHNFGGGATSVDRFVAAMYAGSLNIAGEVTSGNRLGFVINNLPLNQWHHVVFVLDGNGTTSLNTTILYLNGEKYDSPGAVGLIWDSSTFDIGGTVHGYQNQLIAGVKVFNTKLTDAQARELYHYPEQVLPTGISASNLRRYYPLSDYNDTAGTGGRYFQDMGADGEPLEDKGSATMAFAQPVPCPQLGLQQSATRHFFTGASSQSWRATVTAPGTTATLSGWMFWGDSSRTSYLAAIAQVTHAADSFNIRINAGFGDVTMYKAGEIDSGLNVNEGEWNHIVVTTKSTSPYWRCWVNGVEASSPAVAPVTNITTGFVYPGSNSTPFPLNGFINDVAFWDAELDTPDVAALYNSGVQGMDVSTVQSANLKGWWKADDLTTFKDYSGNGADAVTFGASGTIIGASFPENASGSTIVGDFSLKRKGVSVLNPTATPLVASVAAGARIANDGSLNIDPANGGHTVSFFIRVEMGSASGGMMLSHAAGTATANWHLCYFTSTINAVPPRLQIGDGATTYRDYIWPAAITNPEEWHQLAYTVDFSTSPTTFRLYQDGALVSTQATYNHLAIDTGDVMHVGNSSSGTLNFPGSIACLKMYQTKLSDDEVEQIYRSDLRLIKGLANE